MIRVLQVVTRMTSGGTETLLMNIYRQIDRSQVQFDFLVQTEEKQFYDDEILSLGGRIFRAPYYNLANRLAYRNAIVRTLKDHPEITIVHAHNNFFSDVVLEAAQIAGIRVRIAHAHIAQPQLLGWRQYARYATRPIAIRSFRRHATLCLACSDMAGDWIFGKNAGYRFIPNAIDFERFRFDPAARAQIRNELAVDGCTVYGHVGRMSRQKNHEKLLNVFAKICKKDPNARLILLGKGSLREALEAQSRALGIADQVMFLGTKQNVPDYYAAMDAFIFPSFWEGMPVTVIETQVSGLPTLISDHVTPQVAFTKAVEILPLEASDEAWADRAMAMAAGQRFPTPESNGCEYDIKTAAVQWMKIYLSGEKGEKKS